MTVIIKVGRHHLWGAATVRTNTGRQETVIWFPWETDRRVKGSFT